jgi:hypothetical protein
MKESKGIKMFKHTIKITKTKGPTLTFGGKWTILQGLEIHGPKEVRKQAPVILSLEIS